MASVVGSSRFGMIIAILVFFKIFNHESDHVNNLVVAQILFTKPWRDVALLLKLEQLEKRLIVTR